MFNNKSNKNNGYSQVTASVRANQHQQQPKNQQKTVLLTNLLTELENRYQVRFNYSVDLLKGVQVNAEDIRKYKSIDKSLNQLLERNTQLRCKKIDKDTYVIVRNKENMSENTSSTEATSPANNLAGNTAADFQNQADETVVAPQAIRVSGTVTGENDEPMVGVSVSEKGTTNGTVTDTQGKYALNVTDEKSVLVFSFIGYISEEMTVGNQTQLNVKLQPDLKALQEVVVVAYGTQKRTDITGAVGLVNPAEAKKVQTASIAEQLQGRVAGVQVTTSGEPGATSQVRVRGVGTFTGGNPIWVIDGVILEGSFPDFNPNDVETIQVLKDASATALYGSRGMNGVIIVTTKKGQPGAVKVDYNGYYGVQNIARRIPYVGGDEFRRLATEAYRLAGKPAPGFNPGVNTDWQEELIKPGVQTDHNVSVSGGSEKSTFLVSAGYFSQDGTIVGSWFK
ncbi:MAG: carboxypeptidase-like regulatory domain-containing protein [Cytophagales bacterium]|nr:carboxypeptidase-like regulatory domain-containing protein [Cytophagales bacterium]